MPTTSVLLITYGDDLPSFRHRLAHLTQLPELDCVIKELPSRRYVRRIIELKAAIQAADVVVLSKLKLNPIEGWLIKAWSKRTFYDVDDAIYLKRPRHIGEEPGRSQWRWRKFKASSNAADTVVVGNQHLADVVSAFHQSVVIIPTPVDVTAYQAEQVDKPNDDLVRAVWVGLPSNLAYLELIRPALVKIAQQYPQFRLRIVSSRAVDWTDMPIEFVEWSHEGEKQALLTADIGLMPLTDDEWSRGKCAFKLLQYMAAGLPCVASPVGANCDAVIEQKTGFWAEDTLAWQTALEQLLVDLSLGATMGWAGQQRAEQLYDVTVTQQQWRQLLGVG